MPECMRRESARVAENTDGAGVMWRTGVEPLIHTEWYHKNLTLSRANLLVLELGDRGSLGFPRDK